MGLQFKYCLQKQRRAALLPYLKLTAKRFLRNTRYIRFFKLDEQSNYIYNLSFLQFTCHSESA